MTRMSHPTASARPRHPSGGTRRAGAVLLAVTALVATACGRAEGGEAAGSSVESEPVAEGPVEGTVTVWAMGAEGENLEPLAELFMSENPDVDIQVTAVPWDAAHDKIATAIAAGETPDVSLVGSTWMGEFASTGALDQLPAGLIDPDDFFEGSFSTTEVDGVAYGAPWYTETRVLYYRTDLAEEAGITEAPQTWDELKALAVGMQDAGAEHGITLQAGGTGSWQTFLPFAWQNGAELEGQDALTLDSPELVEAIEYYDSFFTEGLSPTALDPGALEAGFVDGSIGAFVSGPWHMSILDEQGGEEFRESWDVAPMPEEVTGSSFVGGGDLVVFRDSENRDAAWRFVEFLTRPEVQQEFYASASALPTNRTAWESGELADDARLAIFGEQLDQAQSPPVMATWEQVADAIDTELEKVTVGDLTAQDAATAMQAQADAIGTGD